MKLWDKGQKIDALIEEFTTGKDREFDVLLASHDIRGSMAHSNMLEKIGMLTAKENQSIQSELQKLLNLVEANQFEIENGVEDVHSQIEIMLTKSLGSVGKKVHLGRSRNDQVLVDLRLYFRSQLEAIGSLAHQLAEILIERAHEGKEKMMPGYTHMQVAMMSSFGMWFGAFAESLIEDLEYSLHTFRLINRNPLGTAAGYGSSIHIDREMTTTELGFDGLVINPIHAQNGRGKTEWLISNVLASYGHTFSKMAMDLCLYSNENHAFFTLPSEFTTGSSIMPHKKNPDVFELIRAKSNILISIPAQVSQILGNLPTGYHRDYQLLKEVVFPGIKSCQEILTLLIHCIPGIRLNHVDLNEKKYEFLRSVDRVNLYVIKGMPFREAYQKVALEIESGSFTSPDSVEYSHIGSLGNLGLERLEARLKNLMGKDRPGHPDE